MSGILPLLTIYAFIAWTGVILSLPFISVEPSASMFRVEDCGAGWREDRYRLWYPAIISRAIDSVRKTGFHKPSSHPTGFNACLQLEEPQTFCVTSRHVTSRHVTSRSADSVTVVLPPRNFTLPSFVLQVRRFSCVIRKVVQLVVYRLAIRNTHTHTHTHTHTARSALPLFATVTALISH